MNGLLGHNPALARLYWAGNNLGSDYGKENSVIYLEFTAEISIHNRHGIFLQHIRHNKLLISTL